MTGTKPDAPVEERHRNLVAKLIFDNIGETDWKIAQNRSEQTLANYERDRTAMLESAVAELTAVAGRAALFFGPEGADPIGDELRAAVRSALDLKP